MCVFTLGLTIFAVFRAFVCVMSCFGVSIHIACTISNSSNTCHHIVRLMTTLVTRYIKKSATSFRRTCYFINTCMLHSLLVSSMCLDRITDWIRTRDIDMHIIHTFYGLDWDRYVLLVRCSERDATYLSLLEG